MPDSRIRKLSRNFSRSISRSSSDSWIPLTRHSTYSLPSLAQSDEIPTHSPASRPARHDPLEPAYLPPFSKYSTSRSPPKPAYDFSAPLTSNPLSGFSGITLTVPPPTYHRQSQHGALIDPEWEFHLQDGPHTIKHGHDPTFLSSDTNASNYKIAGGSSYGSEVPRSTSTGPSSPKQGSIIHPDDQPDLIDDDDDEDEPQDSTQAWLHSVTAFFTVLNGWGLPSTFGIYQSYYTFAPDLPKSLTTSSLQSLAWIGSTQLGLSFLMGLPMGYAVDKGHLSPAFKLSSLVLALSVLSTSLCRSYTSLFFVQGVLTGLGCGGVVGSGLPVLSSWFSPRNRAKGMALAAAGSCIGTAMYAVIARECLRRYGFEITFRVIGTVVAITLLPACCVFRYRRVVKRDERQYVLFRRSGPDETKDKPWWANVQKDYVFAMAGMFCAFLGEYRHIKLGSHRDNTGTDTSTRSVFRLCLYRRLRQRHPRRVCRPSRQSLGLHVGLQPRRSRLPGAHIRPLHRADQHHHPVRSSIGGRSLALDRGVGCPAFAGRDARCHCMLLWLFRSGYPSLVPARSVQSERCIRRRAAAGYKVCRAQGRRHHDRDRTWLAVWCANWGRADRAQDVKGIEGSISGRRAVCGYNIDARGRLTACCAGRQEWVESAESLAKLDYGRCRS